MAFFRLIARISTFCDKKYRILTFRDKTESGSLSGSLWLSLAHSGSLLLSEIAHKALARLVASLLRYNTLFSPGFKVVRA